MNNTMKKGKLIFIGPIDMGNIPQSGDTMKNQLFIDRFLEVFDTVYIVDTMNWRKNPLVVVRMLCLLIFHCDSKVIISANTSSAHSVIKLLKRMPFTPKDVFYWVVGGAFHRKIENGIYSAETYKWLKGIFVQGHPMVDSLRKQGLNNAVYVANSKLISHYGKAEKKKDGKTHFVFLSRIEEYKGCTDIIRAVDKLIYRGYQNRFDVTFYGRESENHQYALQFSKMIDERPDIRYKGVLNLRDTNNYDELSDYDVMLFPTYWQGEGFPGIVIDAFVASLPVIASDWNFNKYVVTEGETGWIIPVHDNEALVNKMEYVITHPEEVIRMSRNCRNAAGQYDSRVVLSKENLVKIGLLDNA